MNKSENKEGKLDVCQMIRNVIKTHMEMRKKGNRGVVSKVAKKILKSKKKKVGMKVKKLAENC